MANIFRMFWKACTLALISSSALAQLISNNASEEGGFHSQCQSVFVNHDNGALIMSGFCPSCSYFWVGRCFANADGALVPAAGGNFDRSCDACIANDWKHPGWMTCSCWTAGRDGPPRRVEARVDLNESIHVRDGVLGCAGEEGRWCGT
ncbi:hypothetical protein QBC33DRAFT_525092 [Phialemonium atrogriseum]|uniref:Cyanovirin-N domain-containing protein n=1 Tax=Phialemonium atrogriseum TaxID=1093897 RepID=A0AAJ0C822_9PEZI|nr:uncharacterized protein QBC33DRAFT_525092 [Phialemonium atrogriseum]KAK1771878.1 hypothetical protein QBC33DRAFT_525092 [Phialemonium atrogriseum]